MQPGLSVVIPAYNEEDNVAACLAKVYSVVKGLGLDYEIILVNDGSRDRTGQIAKSFLKKIPHLKVVENKPNRGYGGSLRRGFDEAKKEFITFVPADNQFDFAEITKLLEIQRETEADIVSGIRTRSSDPWYRSANRWGWNSVVRALFGYLATDIDCGFKLFRRSILEKITLESDGAMVDTELFAGARARGMKIRETPVTHLPRTAGKATGANLKVVIRAFRDLLLFWWRLKQEILVEQGRAVFRWEAIALIGILFIAAFSRLWDIGNYMTFLGDEGRDALAVRDIVLGRHFPLIGPGTSIGSMYLGPWYYYLIAPGLLVSQLSPVGPSVEVALLGIVTVFLLWWIGRQWFGRGSALVAALLYAISPAVIIYSRSSWNPNVMPFFSLLCLYAIWKVWRLGYWRWLLLAAASFAMVLNSHYLGLLLVPAIALYWLLAKKNNGWKKYSLLSVLLFLILMSPLVFFDARHNWSNSSALKTFFTYRQTTVNLKIYKAIPQAYPLWTDIVTTLLVAGNKTAGNGQALFLVTATLLLLVLNYRTKKDNRDLIFVLVWILSGLIGLGLYKQHVYTHYYGFLFPALFLLLGFILSSMSSLKPLRLPVILLTIFLIVQNVINHPLREQPNRQLAHTREIAEFVATQAEGRPFNLALLSKSNYDAAYRYFLVLNEAPYRTVHEQLTDQLFVICEDTQCKPVGNPLWEIASFGWARVDRQWEFPWQVKVYRLVHNPGGQPDEN